MNKSIVGLVVAAVITFNSPASAQSGGYKDESPEVGLSTSDWTGFWFGGGIGGGSVVHEIDFGTAGSFNGIGGEGAFLTFGLGYDHLVRDRVLLGAFADYDLPGISSEANFTVGNATADHQYSLSVGGRLGYLLNSRTLAYGLAAYTKREFDASGSVTLNGSTYSFSGNQDFDGIMVGGGLESKLSKNVSLKGEYRYTSFQEEYGIAPSMHTGRLTLAFKFNRNDDF